MHLWKILTATILVIGGVLIWRNSQPGEGSSDAAPVNLERSDPLTRTLTMGEVLDMASDAREHMSSTLKDYTARFVKQEVDTKGVMSEVTEISMRVQTRLRNDSNDAPMRVYLHFNSPESTKNREVIWASDLYDGQMAVYEPNNILVSWKTLWLDPNGFLAMQGQRYPISEIGLVKLVEKLIERGEKDRDNPDISVTLTREHKFDETPAELIQVTRAKPSGDEEDFSSAEIIFDPEKKLILAYRSFGWAEKEGDPAPLLESYTYHDVKTNVGLSEEDFNPENPEYSFP